MAEQTDEDARISAHAVTVRLRHAAMSKADWQRKHDLRIGPMPKYVDRERSALNRVLIEPPPASVMQRRALELRQLQAPQRAARTDMAVATAGLITLGTAAQRLFLDLPVDTQDRAVLAIASRIADRYGCILVGAVIHLDESAPHAHLTFESRCRLDGKPFSKLARGASLQTIAAEAIAEFEPRIGRGRPRPPTPDAATVHRQVRQLHEDLPAEIEARKNERDRIAREVEDLERRRDELIREAGEFAAFRQQFHDRVQEWNRLVAAYLEQCRAERAQLDEERARLAEAGVDLPPRVDIEPAPAPPAPLG